MLWLLKTTPSAVRLRPLHNLRCTGAPKCSTFVDGADIIQYINLPTRQTVYEILRSALWEFVRKRIVQETVRVLFSFTSRHPCTSLFAFTLVRVSDFNFNFISLPSR
ncbi:hypothetical protein BV22DRAFT_1025744 [Leucogyrophana mollusca]|uniref:Uncharacterized protein n=1 Tax=Leucogyrophana mollusca TaxID=85980 RepID=A0ACB8AW61_9AGAM|nr:hypothetical protein BV22DRAFT_1025744 [Leucogyrophana mollusca]